MMMATYPQSGDILVSRSTGRIEHDVTIVSDTTHKVCSTHDRAIAVASELARARHVDVWLTEDHTHFIRLATYRSG
jgi:hypothetical protein